MVALKERGHERTGFSRSRTVMRSVHERDAPLESVAVYVRIVAPTGKDEPEVTLGLRTSETMGRVLVTFGARQKAGPVLRPVDVGASMALGHTMVMLPARSDNQD
jgi:hypothetical protein